MADWENDAACRDQPTDLFFPDTDDTPGLTIAARDAITHAKAICARCPVRRPCLDAALDRGETYGVWGGLSGRQLDRARKQRRTAAA